MPQYFCTNTKENSKNIPTPIHNNVSRVFGGKGAEHIFFTTQNNELFALGQNKSGRLGNGLVTFDNSLVTTPKKIPNWKGNDVLDLYCGRSHSVLITKEGHDYSCVRKMHNGSQKNLISFARIPALKKQRAVKIDGGRDHNLILTPENDLFGWNFYHNARPTDQYQTRKQWALPRKIDLPIHFVNNPLIKIDFSCGCYSTFIFSKKENYLLDDLKILVESKKYCDAKFILSKEKGHEIPIYKILVELRTNSKIEKIQKIINIYNFSKKEIKNFLKWVYFNEITYKNQETIRKIFKLLNLTEKHFEKTSTIQHALLELFHDEKSKDFTILLKENEKNGKKDNNNNNNNSNDKNKEKNNQIRVHKFILLARSGLFRQLFEFADFENENDKNNLKQITDYTKKSKQSLETLIKYFYTNKIEIPDGSDPELIKDELMDSVEYYQLNGNSNFITKLNLI
ncbi:hypothetical protein M0812_20491 [Anaeramoeba flamelloides]|uniref:BTB domain-containing protein n=1 Tax=Anaeramoeba flamelloides TaxID=1746091 RepID=A0AAV7YQ02_9EUKA|nr:hypothetical protein M0812_20491 [Anaeramoeba flamelloides]